MGAPGVEALIKYAELKTPELKTPELETSDEWPEMNQERPFRLGM